MPFCLFFFSFLFLFCFTFYILTNFVCLLPLWICVCCGLPGEERGHLCGISNLPALHGLWGLNLGGQACTASALSPEPSCWPLVFFFLIVWHVLLKAEESVPFPGAGVTGHCEMPTLVLGTELGSCGRAGNTVNPWVNFPAHTDNVNDLCCLWESLGLTLYGKYFLNRTRSYKVWPHHPSKKALENAPHQDLRKKHP